MHRAKTGWVAESAEDHPSEQLATQYLGIFRRRPWYFQLYRFHCLLIHQEHGVYISLEKCIPEVFDMFQVAEDFL